VELAMIRIAASVTTDRRMTLPSALQLARPNAPFSLVGPLRNLAITKPPGRSKANARGIVHGPANLADQGIAPEEVLKPLAAHEPMRIVRGARVAPSPGKAESQTRLVVAALPFAKTSPTDRSHPVLRRAKSDDRPAAEPKAPSNVSMSSAAYFGAEDIEL